MPLKPRLPCPLPDCHRRVHENDVDALLDPANAGLDAFLDPAQRAALLQLHRELSVWHALGGPQAVACPGCPVS